MKYYSYLIIIFITLLYSTKKDLYHPVKETSGVITYKYIPNKVSDHDREESKELYDFLEKVNSLAKNVEFTLEFNDDESLFSINEIMDLDLNPMAMSYIKNVVARGKYYYIKSKDIILRQEDLYGNNTLVKSISSKVNNWKLINESKKIGDYTCYKATREKTKQGINEEHKFTIEAWYCPELAMTYGPKEFNGLPGLILELKDTHHTFYVENMKILNDSTITIKPLESKNIISEEEHLKKIKEIYSKQ